MNRLKRIVNTAVLVAMLAPCPAWAQQAAGSSLGTVTALQGQATVGRAALPQPTPMKFRDDVFFRDQITTKEQSTLRLLLGGKGVLTIREQSQVTLDESVAPTGERRSVLNLLGGKIAAAIARSLMRPGEEVEVRTPNAVAAVRGTVLIAEYIPPRTSAEAPNPVRLASSDPKFRVAQAATPAGGQTTFLVLTGSVTVTAQGAPPVTVGAMQTVSISVGPAGVVQVGAVQTATQGQVAQATQGLQMEKSISGPGDGGQAVQAQAQVAATLTNAIVQATAAASAPPAPPLQQPASTPVPDATQTPPVPTTTLPNDLPSGPLLQLNALTMAVPSGTTVMTFGPGSANAVVPIVVTGTGMESTVTALPATGTFDITGNPITHTGPLLGLSAAALVASDYTTPLMQVNGTKVTATASGTTGALATVDGGSFLQVGGAMFLLAGGGTLNLSGAALNISGESSVVSGGPLFYIQGKSTLTTSGGPLVRITGGELVANGLGGSDGTGNQITIGGGLLDATNASIVLTEQPNQGSDGDKAIMAQPAGVPQVRLTSSALSMTNGSVVDLGPGPTYNGLLLIATDSSINLQDARLWGLWENAISTTEASVPLIQFTNTDLDNTGGGTTSITGILKVESGSLTLAGPLMSVTGGELKTRGSLLGVYGATLTATTTQPLFQFSNAIFDSSADVNSVVNFSAPIFSLSGNASLTLAGSLLSASGATFNVNGPLLRLDNSLLNAANSTIFQITGGTVTSNKTDTNGAIYLYNSQITTQQVASLTSSDIQITNGPLLNVMGGSQMMITGDLATLTNGAKITVSNGPLINVDGATSKLTVNGALVNFVGTGNQVIITNSLTPNSAYPAAPYIPIQTSNNGTVTFGPGSDVVKNPGGGTVTVNGVALNSDVPHTGSVIRAVNGGTVVIEGGTPPPPTTLQNDLPSGPLLQLNALTMGVPTGTTVMKFGPGSANAVVPFGMTGTGMVESPVIPLPAAGTFDITGNPITHSGPLLVLSAAALVANDITTPLMQVNGTTFKSTGPLVSLTGGSILSVSGPVLDITNGTLDAAGHSLIKLDSNNGFTSNTDTPLVRVSNGSLTADALLWMTGTGNFGTLSGPVLEGNNADITLRVLGGEAIEGKGNDLFPNPGPGVPFIRLTNSNLTLTEAGKPLVDPVGGTGVGLIAINNSEVPKTITVNGPLLRLWSVNLLGDEPFIQFSNMTVQATSPAIEISDGSSSTTVGPLLSASGSTLNVDGTFVLARNGARLTATTSSPLLQFSGSTVATNGPLFKAVSNPGQPGSTVNLAGPLLSASNTSFNTGANSNFVSIADGSTFQSTSTLPFLNFAGGSLTTTSHVMRVGMSNIWSGGVRVFDGSQGPVTMTLAGPLLSTTDTSITATSSLLGLRDGATFTSRTALPLITLGQSGGTVGPTVSLGGPDPDPASPTYGQYSNGSLFTMQPLLGQPITASLAGSLLASNHAIITTDRILSVFGNTGATSTLTDTTAAPLLSFSGSQADATLNFMALSNNAPTMTLTGGLLAASNSTLTNGNPMANDNSFLFIGDSAHLTSTGSGSLLAFDGTSVVTAGDIVTLRRSNSSSAPSMLTLSGGLFSATNNSSVSTTSLGYPGGTSTCCSAFFIGQGAQLVSTTAGSALITLTNSTFNVGPDARSGGQFFQVSDGGANPGESNTLVAPSSVSLNGSLLMANGSRLSALYSLLYLNNSSLTDGYPGSPLIQFGTTAGNTITLGGVRTDPISPGSFGWGFLANLNGSSTLSLQGSFLGSTNDTLTATGGILRIGSGSTLTSTTTTPLISLSGGTHTFGDASSSYGRLLDMQGTHTDPIYGYGTDQPLQTGGIFFQASGATVNLTGGSSTGAAIKVDTALLNAAAPIVDLINSTVNLNNAASSSPGAVQLLNAVANVTGPAVNLNNSTISIQNGPLFSLTGGAQMNVTGDLARLANGSRLTVVNGPLISVDGVNAKGTASALIASGALVNFVGSGNQVIVNNALTPNYTTGMGSLPVFTDNLGTASTNIVVGPYPVKNPAGGTLSVTGSLLKVTNGGRVNVTAPAP